MQMTLPADLRTPANEGIRLEAIVREEATGIAHVLGARATIGRVPGNAICLQHQTVSSTHAEISALLGANAGRFKIIDAKSLNGTLVNGVSASERELEHGDIITIGAVRLEFMVRRVFPRRCPTIRELRPVPDPHENIPRRFDDHAKKLKGAKDFDQSPDARRVSYFHASDLTRTSIVADKDATSAFRSAEELGDRDSLKQDYERLRIAHEISERIALAENLDEVLQSIIEETLRLIPGDRCAILLVDRNTNKLEPAYVHGAEDDEITISKGILDTVRAQRRALLSSDVQCDERLLQSRHSLSIRKIRSAMCVPMVTAGELIGVFHVDTYHTKAAFTENHLLAFSAIANQAATSIENQRLLDKIRAEEATRATLARLMPPSVVNQVVSGKIQLEGKGIQRRVTMLFVDIRGFTAMSERHAPVEMVGMLNEYFELLVEVLFENGGTLDKYVGDELIGLFGAHLEIEDAEARAVRCGLQMQKRMEYFNMARAHRGLAPIEIGVGINSGPVVVGAIGSSKTMQYTVIGDAVNVAARLCSAASAGDVLVSESTYKACRGLVRVKQAHAMQLKGKERRLRVYSVEDTQKTDELLVAGSPHDESETTEPFVHPRPSLESVAQVNPVGWAQRWSLRRPLTRNARIALAMLFALFFACQSPHVDLSGLTAPVSQGETEAESDTASKK